MKSDPLLNLRFVISDAVPPGRFILTDEKTFTEAVERGFISAKLLRSSVISGVIDAAQNPFPDRQQLPAR